MFNLDLSPTFWWTVKFTVPREDGVAHDSHTFDGQFRRMESLAIEELMNRVGAQRLGDDVIARELLVGWRGVVDKSNASIAFGPGNLDRVLAIPGVGAAVVAAFFEAVAKGPGKN